jgi:hypothetical protein
MVTLRTVTLVVVAVLVHSATTLPRPRQSANDISTAEHPLLTTHSDLSDVALPSEFQWLGTKVVILKKFSPKKLALLHKILQIYAKKLIRTLVFNKNAIF